MLSQADATGCTFLLKVGSELKDVAKGSILQPLSRKYHCRDIPANELRVRVDLVLPGFENLYPPNQPADADSELNLGQLDNQILLWPKALIRLNTTSGSAPSQAMTVTTTPVAPAASQQDKVQHGNVLSPPPVDPPPPEHETSNDEQHHEHETHDDYMDIELAPIDDFINQLDGEKPVPPELPARTLDIQKKVDGGEGGSSELPTRKPDIQKKLTYSQETPEEQTAFTAPQPTLVTPNTLRATAAEAVKQSGTPICLRPKKNRKRPGNKKKGGASSSSQPAAARVLDRLPPAVPWRKVHEIGQPMLPPEVVAVMGGDMRTIHDGILFKENELLREKHPSYPLYVVKVPRSVGFVDSNPAEVFFIRYEDIFRVFHLGKLDRSIVRLVSLSMAHDMVMENTPHIAIMDPYYMNEDYLRSHADRVLITTYITGFLIDNKDKNAILMPYFPK